MASITALQLTNRVLRLARSEPVSDLTNEKGMRALECVNLAKSFLLESKNHSFDLRHDGELVTKDVQTITDDTGSGGSVNTSVTNGNQTLAVLSGYSGSESDFVGSFVTRARVTTDAAFGNTAFRVQTASSGSGLVNLGIGIGFPGTTDPGPTFQTFASEYLLPDTVRAISNVVHEETPLELRDVAEDAHFETLVPRPHEDLGSDPRVVMVGGWDVETYNTSANEPAPKLRMIVWPVPTSGVLLRYSYWYRHPDLEDPTDSLVGVPPAFTDRIVETALATYQGTVQRDVQAGAVNGSTALSRLRSVTANDRPNRRRRIVHAWGSTSGRYRHPHDTRHVTLTDD